jgi:hypothetical protein
VRDTERALRAAASSLGGIVEHLDDLSTPDAMMQMNLTGALWYQEARLGLLVAIAKLTATAEMIQQDTAARKIQGPGLYVPGPTSAPPGH